VEAAVSVAAELFALTQSTLEKPAASSYTRSGMNYMFKLSVMESDPLEEGFGPAQ
jgi:hypothetical protein